MFAHTKFVRILFTCVFSAILFSTGLSGGQEPATDPGFKLPGWDEIQRQIEEDLNRTLQETGDEFHLLPPDDRFEPSDEEIELLLQEIEQELAGEKPEKEAAFNGRFLYKQAFETVRDRHRNLMDPKVRARWIAEWEHKFDKGKELDSEKGADKAIERMVKSLKAPFDSYLDRSNTEDHNREKDAKLVGIGINIEALKTEIPGEKQEEGETGAKISDQRALTITKVFAGGPAEKAGLKKSDLIRKVDGKDVNGLTVPEAARLIRGEKDTEVKLTVERMDEGGKKSTKEFKLKRAVVVIKAVEYKDLGEGLHYVKLKNFMSSQARAELLIALVKAHRGRGLILDLRDNGGGLLDLAVWLSAQLMPEGVVVVTRVREGDGVEEVKTLISDKHTLEGTTAGKDTRFTYENTPQWRFIPSDMPIVVLVNENSASASEIVAGALQKNHRATVLGKPTYGKGVGQHVIKLPFDRTLVITTFEFLPGGGKPIHGIGIIPDIEVDPCARCDCQLRAAQEQLQRMITQKEKLEKRREQLRKEKENRFKEDSDD